MAHRFVRMRFVIGLRMSSAQSILTYLLNVLTRLLNVVFCCGGFVFGPRIVCRALMQAVDYKDLYICHLLAVVLGGKVYEYKYFYDLRSTSIDTTNALFNIVHCTHIKNKLVYFDSHL